MKYDPNIHRRRSTRLPHWDYTWAWWYYVTICVKDRHCFFGRIENDHVVASEFGIVVSDCWKQIPNHHKGVELDDFVVMPNHVHGILILNDIRRDVQLNVPTTTDPNELINPPKIVEEIRSASESENMHLFASRRDAMAALSPKKGSLSVVVRTFKAAVTSWARNHNESFGWQERFYEHIIRNDADLHRVRTYIGNNPLKWALDEENPENES